MSIGPQSSGGILAITIDRRKARAFVEGTTKNGPIAVQAFIEKRDADFQGR